MIGPISVATRTEILEHEEANDNSCFLIDWRCDFEELFDEINSRLTDRQIEPVQPAKGYEATIACGSKKASSKSLCRVEVLKAIDKVLREAPEEMRFVAESLQSDTICLLIKPKSWWKAMDKNFREEMSSTYVKVKDANTD